MLLFPSSRTISNYVFESFSEHNSFFFLRHSQHSNLGHSRRVPRRTAEVTQLSLPLPGNILFS